MTCPRPSCPAEGAYLGHERHRVTTEWSDPRHGQVARIADLPYRWRSFSNIALDLLEQGKGRCLCLTCRQIYPAADVSVVRSTFGTECVTASTEALCPARHVLLRSAAHLRLRADGPTPRQNAVRAVR